MYRVLTTIIACYTPSLFAATVHFLNWEDYLAPELVTLWQQQSGHQINQIYIDNDEARDVILATSAAGSIDLVVLDEVSVQVLGRRGELVKLTHLENRAHIRPEWLARCGDYGVPYFWGTLGIAYRSDKVSKPESWQALLTPNRALQGHIGMLNDYQDLLSPALMVLGYSVNTNQREPLSEAYQLLQRQSSSVLTYDYPVSFLQHSKRADQLHMAMVYGGDEYSLNEIAGQEDLWQYTIPKEGTVTWVDCLSIPKGSTSAQQAESLITFLLTPEFAAQNADEIGSATPNGSALKLLPAESAQDPQLYPPQQVLKQSQHYVELTQENLLLRQRITSSLVRHHDSH